MAGNSQWFVARRRGSGVFDLSGQVLNPVLQVLLVGAHHLETVEHGACRDRGKAGWRYVYITSPLLRSSHVALPLSSKAFL